MGTHKGLLLIHNKDERALIRQHLSEFGIVSLFNNLPEGLTEVQNTHGALNLIVLDERFDQSVEAKNAGLKIHNILEAFNAAPERPTNAVVMVILNESTTLEAPVLYSESGTDIFLRRPFGAQDLKDKIAEAVTWVDSPPAVVKLLRVFLAAVQNKRVDEVLGGLESFYQKNPQNVRAGMLYARALVQKGGESRSRGAQVARTLDDRFPESLFAKKLLIDAYQGLGQNEEALTLAIKLHGLDPSEATFQSAFAIAEKLFAGDPAQVSYWMPLLAEVGKQEPLRTKERRLAILKRVTSDDLAPEAIRRLMEFLGRNNEDILASARPQIEKWMARLKQLSAKAPDDTELEQLYCSGLGLLLDVEPGLPWALEAHTDLCLLRGNLKLAEKYLLAARTKAKPSREFYSSFTRLCLEEGSLKEASDNLHLGRRLAPSHDCWEQLSKIWSAKYKAAQEAAEAAELAAAKAAKAGAKATAKNVEPKSAAEAAPAPEAKKN
ncbi:MAG: hypothetical protein JST16_07205 [Bdellovibrionales bacterium]|nr:hypothetical protein [Bdellovibrionales bacterium]